MMLVPKPSYGRRIPKRSDRGKFKKMIRKQAYERDNGQCQICLSPGTELHHCMFKSRGGRGVLTNALTLCSECHREIHQDNSLAEYWIDVYADRYGPDFYKDEWDHD